MEDNRAKDADFLLIAIRDSVDKLTRPYKETVIQDGGGPKVELIKHTVDFKPLLMQLQEAIGSSQSMVSRGSSDISTRSVLDAGALMLMTTIEDELKDLWLAFFNGVLASKPLETGRAIRQLLIRINKTVMDNKIDNDELWKTKNVIARWVELIETKFDPPVVIEVTRPCPQCRASFVFDEFNDRYLALVVEWHKSFETSSAECRSCGYTWMGQTELRQMRWALDQLDEELDFSDTPDQEE